ncbi:MAG: TonB-dependent receptor [Bacillota bacterium]|nr:TonB-dependent receptor [Bacillota bacterium]
MSKLLSAQEGLFYRPRANLLALLLVSILTLGPAGRAASPSPQGEAEAAEDEDIIVVTATRLPQPASEVPAVVTVVTVEEALAAGATTVAEAIRLAPTAVVNAHGGLGSAATVNLQGASSNQVQILVDGRTVTTALGPVDVGLLSLSGVERIEIVQGPASAVYGANALGGVVNIITRRPPEQRENRLELSVGGFDAHRLQWSTGAETGWGSYLVTGSTEASAGWRPNSDASLCALTTKLAWAVPGGEATLGARYVSASAGSPGDDGTYPFSLGPTPHARRGDESVNLDLAYRSASPGQPELRLYYTDATWTYDDPDKLESSRHHGVFGGIEARRGWATGRHRILVGGEYRGDYGSSTNLLSDCTSQNLALYVEDLYRTGPALSFTLGGRLDAHSIYGPVWSPRLGAVYQFGAAQRLWLSAGRAFRAPSFQDLYWKADAWSEGNPDLRPETATAYQAGLSAGPLDLTVFHKDVADNINWAFNPSTGKYQPTNLSATRFDGLDLTLHRKLGPWVTAEAAYSWLNAVNAETGKRLPQRPTDQGSVRLGVTAPGGWAGAVAVKVVGSSYYDVANTVVAPGFTKVDLTLSRTVNPSLTWRVNLDNALNARYQEVPGYPMPGASLSTSVTYRF